MEFPVTRFFTNVFVAAITGISILEENAIKIFEEISGEVNNILEYITHE